MCFSIKIPRNINQLSFFFDAEISADAYEKQRNLLLLQQEMDGLEFEKLVGLPHSKNPRSHFKMPGSDDRVFPGYFAPVIVQEGLKRIVKPMRYRVRPSGSKTEIPAKFGVYNARIDSLETKQTWKPLFMHRHGLVPFTNFYEWVPDPSPEKVEDLSLFNFLDNPRDNFSTRPQSKSKLISFNPEGRELMWAPCLWDEWTSTNGDISFYSFAILTDDPPEEVSIMGHDRCPIFIKNEFIDEWLNPLSSNKNEIYEILKSREEVKYAHSWS